MSDPFRPDANANLGWSPWAPREGGQAPAAPATPIGVPPRTPAAGAPTGQPVPQPRWGQSGGAPAPWAPAAPITPAAPPTRPAPEQSGWRAPASPPPAYQPPVANAYGSSGPWPPAVAAGYVPPRLRPPEGDQWPPSKRSDGKAVTALIGAVVGAVVAALIAAIVVAQTNDSDTSVDPVSVSPRVTSSGGRGGLDVLAVLNSAEPSVVSVQTDFGEGSGFVISSDGFVVTNAHVIEGATALRVRFADGSVEEAEMIGAFPDDDVALVKVTDRDDLQPINLGTSADLQVGEDVLAIGNALGLGAAPSVTLGIVSAVDRSVPIDGAVLDDLIQTDAAINHGNSGGPLLNANAEVVGINTLTAEGAQSVGFALSIDSMKPLIEDLKAGRGEITPNTAFLGVSSVAVDDPNLDPQELADYGVTSPFGSLVVEVTPDSPAAKAGVLPGDVIVELDGQEVRSAEDVGEAVRSHEVGEAIEFGYERNGERADKTIVLERKGR